MTNARLQQEAGFSANIITRLKRNWYISLESVESICRVLNCGIERGGQMRKKYYDDAKENAAFERSVDVVTALILKYGPAIKRKWILRDWIKNIQADCFWRSLACKRYQRYFDCMKAIVKNDAT